MHRKIPGLTGLGAAAFCAWFAVGCQGSGSFAKLQETLAGIDQKQDTILARLDQLEEKIGKAPPPGAAPTPQKPKPQAGRPDPAATYKVAVGDASSKGPATAKITIVEWSDFQ